MTKDVTLLILLVLLAVVAVVLAPLAILFALNTLFPVLAIPYGIWQWLSVLILNLTWMYKPVNLKK